MNADKRRCITQNTISKIKLETGKTKGLLFEYLLLDCLVVIGVHRRSSASEIDFRGGPLE
jgi:hypothetical protein